MTISSLLLMVLTGQATPHGDAQARPTPCSTEQYDQEADGARRIERDAHVPTATAADMQARRGESLRPTSHDGDVIIKKKLAKAGSAFAIRSRERSSNTHGLYTSA